VPEPLFDERGDSCPFGARLRPGGREEISGQPVVDINTPVHPSEGTARVLPGASAPSKPRFGQPLTRRAGSCPYAGPHTSGA
jgi:hypothetical protein